MPVEGIFMIAWDPKTGPYIRMSYPPGLGIERDQELVIKVYGGCVIVERAEGYHEIMHDGKEIAAYYSGIDLNLILGAIVVDEEASIYRESIITVAPVIFKKKGLLSDAQWDAIFRIVKSFPQMTLDERIAYALTDPTKKRILEIVGERPGINLQDLRLVLRKKDKTITRAEILGHVDLLERLGIVTKYWVKGDAEPHIGIAREIVFSRKLPKGAKDVVKTIPEIAEAFKKVIDRDWNEEQEEIAQVLSQRESKLIIDQFGDYPLMKKSKLRVPPEMTKTYNMLKKAAIIDEIKNSVVLTSVPVARKLFPKYLVAKILKMLKDNEWSREEAIAFLKAMQKSYLER